MTSLTVVEQYNGGALTSLLSLKFYAIALSSFESIPAHVDGVLTTCAGHQILLTCSHNKLLSGITRWIFSQPVDCSETVDHNPPIQSTDPCGSFTFQDVSELAPDTVLHSTTVATANTSMTGTVVECKDSAGILSESIGNITLCIVGE